ncbi:MAG: hypothetical protein RIK87_01570, partial [Fuerstiella sp.]
MFQRGQLADLFGQVPGDAMVSAAHDGVGRSATAATFRAAISFSSKFEFSALTHERDRWRSFSVHWSTATTWTPEIFVDLSERLRQYGLSQSIFHCLHLLFNVDWVAGNVVTECCNFPTIDPYDNFHVHGVPSLGLRGSNPLVAGFITQQGTPVFPANNQTSQSADAPAAAPPGAERLMVEKKARGQNTSSWPRGLFV